MDEAAQAAKVQFLQQQALMFCNNTRLLKVQLMVADMAGELSAPLKKHLFNELLAMASMMEVKE